jgi:hypothetical protein
LTTVGSSLRIEGRRGAFAAQFRPHKSAAPLCPAPDRSDSQALFGVEGHAWLLDNLEQLLEDPDPLLEVLRLIEREPSLLAMSAHVIAAGTKP